MLYACVNPFVARRNRPSAEDLTHALILPDDHDITLSKFPGVVTAEKTGFGEPVHKELRVKMGVVDELLTDGTNRYWDPPRDAKGQPFSLYPYQLAGVTFTLAKKGRALIMDPMGLGKTLQGIGVLAAGGARNDEALPNDVPYMPAVVVCPGNAKAAWETDLREWTPHIKVRSAESKEQALDLLQSVRPQSPEVVIVKKQYIEELFKTYNAAITQLFSGVMTVIIDESHYVKNRTTRLARAMRSVARVVPHMILLTGTPLLNAAGELFSQLEILETTPTTAPFPFGNQRELLGHMAGDENISLRDQSNFKDFVEYAPKTVEGVGRYLRKRGVRRSREDSIRSGIVLYPKAKSQEDMRKQRTLIVVPHDESVLGDLQAQYCEYIEHSIPECPQHLTARSNSRQAQMEEARNERNEFIDRAQAFQRFKSVLDQSILKNAVDGRVTPAAIDGIFKENATQLKRILLRGHFPVNEEMKGIIADTVIPAVVQHVRGRKRPVVIFTDLLATRDRLRDALVAEGRRVYTTEGSNAVFLREPNRKYAKPRGQKLNPKGKPGLWPLMDRFRYPEGTKKRGKNVGVMPADRNAVIILTKSGLEGLNLSGAEEVVFAGRFSNPGQEYQAEDRINRPDQISRPKVTYFVALDPFSLSLSNRQEKKRNSILSTLGESITDDFSRPMDTEKAKRQAQSQMQLFRDYFGDSLVEPFFAELDPQGFIKDQVRRFFADPQRVQAAKAALRASNKYGLLLSAEQAEEMRRVGSLLRGTTEDRRRALDKFMGSKRRLKDVTVLLEKVGLKTVGLNKLKEAYEINMSVDGAKPRPIFKSKVIALNVPLPPDAVHALFSEHRRHIYEKRQAQQIRAQREREAAQQRQQAEREAQEDRMRRYAKQQERDRIEKQRREDEKRKAEEDARLERLRRFEAKQERERAEKSRRAEDIMEAHRETLEDVMEAIESTPVERAEMIREYVGDCSDMPCQVLVRDSVSGWVWSTFGQLRDTGAKIQVKDGSGTHQMNPSDVIILRTGMEKTLPKSVVQKLIDAWKENPPPSRSVRKSALNNPRARMNLPIEDFEVKPTDESEEQIRRIRLSLFQKFLNEGYSKNKAIRVMGRIYHPGERLDPHDAKTLAFQMAGRRRGSRFMYEGTNKPTALSKHRARQKRSDESAFQKRKDYENMLAVGRKSGPYRVTHEPSYKTGKPVFYIWPLGREYKTESGVKRAWERLK